MIAADGRHPATKQIARWFAYDHLPEGEPREISKTCALMAETMIGKLPDGPEVTAGLRKLLEAKDCFVRAAIERLPAADTGRAEHVPGDRPPRY